MSLVYIGKLALSAILPASVTAVASLSGSLTAVQPVIAADLAGAVSCSGQITIAPPNLSAEVATVQAIILGLQAITIPPTPYVSFQASAVAGLVAELTPIVPGIEASLALGLPLSTLFLETNVQAYSFQGTAAELGGLVSSAVSAGLPDGSGPKSALAGFVLASTGGGTWAGLQAFFPIIPGTQPSGSLVPLGGLDISALVGLLSSGVTDANLSLQIQLANLDARLNGAIAAGAELSINPPSLASTISLAQQLLAELQGPPPSYISASVAISAIASLVTSLAALVASLSAQVTALANITTALATAGVLAFTYSGTAADFGGAVSSAVGSGWPDGTPSSSASNALILLASAPGTGAALSTLFGGI